MFFEPDPTQQAQPEPPENVRARWSAPLDIDSGTVLAAQRLIARSDSTSIRLLSIRAYHDGCLFDIEIACRQGKLRPDDWWDLRMSSHLTGMPLELQNGKLPRKMLRFGVRFADGTKITTIDAVNPHPIKPDEDSHTHRLTWVPSGSSHRVAATGGRIDINHFGLWLSPLPPAEMFELATEWPLGDIELSIANIDGLAVRSASEESEPYWPN